MSENITIAVDAMGGDNSPEKVIKGISLHSLNSQNITYKIFGDEKLINPLLKKNEIKNDFIVHHTIDKINNDDTALGAAKRGKNTSMWMAVNSVKEKNSDIVISAGNTGALFVIAKLNLKMIHNIDKPALSALWPNKNGLNVVLDLGANIECGEKNLVDFSIMGAALHKSLFPKEICKVALLNIGSEEIKGNNVIKNTYKELSSKTNKLYDFCGYIEGNHIMDGDVNIIVTDGFTGNIALKTAEGTANFITSELKSALTNNLLGKISSLLNIKNLNNFKKKLDPRIYNGAMLLGLDSPVVKSHGGTDHIGFFNSLNVCEKIVKGKLIEKIKENIN
ncbi:MAG: phosphate acyltransferase PlsX [Candidatus Pelagibacter sp. TMED118]|nr:MAG: phosphate acyltransferase PlsX [Candidatus Pelagibacter sp. TMED118]